MSTVLWISGASSGIGAALVATVPFDDVLVFDISRSGGTAGTTHVTADLGDPETWPTVAAHMRTTMADVGPDRVLFIHCAATLEPIGPVHKVGGPDNDRGYTRQVLLNSAAPQVLGAAFVAAVTMTESVTDATVVMLSSGAATRVYEGWSAYGAGKAAVDHWVRTVGSEQSGRTRPVTVIAVSPGVVATGMQAQIRREQPADFPAVEKFKQLHADDDLTSPQDAAQGIWHLVQRDDIANGAVIDLRTLNES